jgi:hypothetical protein
MEVESKSQHRVVAAATIAGQSGLESRPNHSVSLCAEVHLSAESGADAS